MQRYCHGVPISERRIGAAGTRKIPEERVNCTSGIISIKPKKLMIPLPLNALEKAPRPAFSIPDTVIFCPSWKQAQHDIRAQSSTMEKNAMTKSISISRTAVKGLVRNWGRLSADR